jgi:hypothetical protein
LTSSAPRQPYWLTLLAATAIGLVATIYFYRTFFTSGFTLVQGNIFDGRLTSVISQHWADPWQFGSILDTGIFYPISQGLIYSDTLLLQGLLSAPLIWMNADPSITFQMILLLVSFIGYISSFILMRLLGSSWLIAVATGLLVNFSNGMLVASDHPQLLTLSLFPASLLMLLLSVRTPKKSLQIFLASLSGAVYGLILYSAFYIGWMLALGLFIALIIWLLLSGSTIRRALVARVGWLRLACLVAGFLPFALITLFTYLPLLQSGLQRELQEVSAFALSARDLFGVSPTNVMWSLPLSHLLGTLRDEEFAMAPTPLVLAVSVMALLLGFRQRNRSNLMGIGLAATGAGLVLWVLPVRWGWFFPWALVYQIPGGSAIRAIGRVEIVAGLFLVFGTAIIITLMWRSVARNRPQTRWLLGLVLAVLIVEQLNFRVEQKVNVAEVTALREIPSPTLQCDSFFIAPPLDTRRVYDNQADPVIDSAIAMGVSAQIVARAQGIPTLNGYSGGEPVNWPFGPSTVIDYPRYEDALAQYIRRFSLENVCGLDLRSGSWFGYLPSAP